MKNSSYVCSYILQMCVYVYCLQVTGVTSAQKSSAPSHNTGTYENQKVVLHKYLRIITIKYVHTYVIHTLVHMVHMHM